MDESRSLIRSYWRQQGLQAYAYSVENNFDWQPVFDHLQAGSLFDDQIGLELRFAKLPGTKEQGMLSRLASLLDSSHQLILLTGQAKKSQLDAKWAKPLLAKGPAVQIWPLDSKQFPNWLKQRASQLGMQLDPQALDFLVQSTAGNPLAAQQELQKLQLLLPSGRIGIQELLPAVSDNSKYSPQDMMDAALMGDLWQALRISQALESEGFASVLWAWTINQDLLCLQHLWQCQQERQPPKPAFKPNFKREAAFNRALQRVNGKLISQLQQLAARMDRISKGSDPERGDFMLVCWQLLKLLAR